MGEKRREPESERGRERVGVGEGETDFGLVASTYEGMTLFFAVFSYGSPRKLGCNFRLVTKTSTQS